MSQFLSQVGTWFRKAGAWFEDPKHWVPVACGGVALILLIVLLVVYVPSGKDNDQDDVVTGGKEVEEEDPVEEEKPVEEETSSKTCKAKYAMCDMWGGNVYCGTDCLAYNTKGGSRLSGCDNVCQ